MSPFTASVPPLFERLVVKVRDRQVSRTPFHVVMGVTTNRERDTLGGISASVFGVSRDGKGEASAEFPSTELATVGSALSGSAPRSVLLVASAEYGDQ